MNVLNSGLISRFSRVEKATLSIGEVLLYKYIRYIVFCVQELICFYKKNSIDSFRINFNKNILNIMKKAYSLNKEANKIERYTI